MRVCDVHGIDPPLVKHGKLKDVCAYCVIEDATSGERQYKKELIAERAKVADSERALALALKQHRDECARAEAAEAKAARLREAIERAPHPKECAGWRRTTTWDHHGHKAIGMKLYEDWCNCWKAEALKEVQRDA